jgi:hypothetical protein
MNLIPLHLGALHPMEQALTLALAFGPFVVLGIVIVVRRHHDRAADDEPERPAPDPQRER